MHGATPGPYTRFVRPVLRHQVEDVPQARLFDDQGSAAEATTGPRVRERRAEPRPPRHRRKRHRRRRTAGWSRSAVLYSETVGAGLLAVVALTVTLCGDGESPPPITHGRAPVMTPTPTTAPPTAAGTPSMPTTGTATESSGPGRRPTPTSGPTQESQAAYCRAPSSCRAHARSLRRGDVGPDVHRLQQFLFGQGFTYVSASGVFDEATVRGVAQYQRNRGITGDPSGVFGPATSASAQAAARQKNTWR